MSISESIYRRHLLRAHNTGNYLLYFRLYAKIQYTDADGEKQELGKLTALFLQDVINIAALPGTKRQTVDGKEFVLCTQEFLIDSGLGWSVKEQRNHIEVLRQAGLIETKKMGIPGRRWLYVDLIKIESALDDLENDKSGPKGHDCKSPEGPDYITKKEEGKNKSRPATPGRSSPGFSVNGNGHSPARNGHVHVDQKLSAWSRRLHDWAEYVLDKRIKWFPRSWDNAFRVVLEEYKGNDTRLEKALAYLESNKEEIKEDAAMPRPPHPMAFGKTVDWIEGLMKKSAKNLKKKAEEEMVW